MFALVALGLDLAVVSVAAATGDLPAWAGGPITAALVAALLITGQLAPGKRVAEERDERLVAQGREREAYEKTLPAVLSSNATLDRVLGVLARLEKPSV